MKLFARLPKLRWQPGPRTSFIPSEKRSDYPELTEDFALLEKELMPKFYVFDERALQAQNQFWLEQLVLLVGSALAAILGTIQIVLIQSIFPGLLETLITIGLAAITYRVREFNAQRRYFTNRLIAEALRSEYYRFLGRIDEYTNDQNRYQNLIENITRIVSKAGRGTKDE